MSLPAFAAVPVFSGAAVLAQQQPGGGDQGGQGEDFGKSSPVGLLLLLVFLIAVALLVRSMTKHLKRVPASFDEPDQTSGDAEAAPGDADGEDDRPEDSVSDSIAGTGESTADRTLR